MQWQNALMKIGNYSVDVCDVSKYGEKDKRLASRQLVVKCMRIARSSVCPNPLAHDFQTGCRPR